MHAVQLSTGHDMPMLGLGTFQLRGPRCVASVEAALTMGYRHIDTAWRYENQREVGEGIRASGVPYDEIFLTSKIWRDQLSKTAALTQHQENLDQLGFEYVDLLLIHWPPATVPLEETRRFCPAARRGKDSRNRREQLLRELGRRGPTYQSGPDHRQSDQIQPSQPRRKAARALPGEGRGGDSVHPAGKGPRRGL